MKTASMPSLRVDPELRHDAESVLREGETLSSFMEQALRASILSRRAQKEFIARGLASRDESKRTCEYYAAEDVVTEMEDGLAITGPQKLSGATVSSFGDHRIAMAFTIAGLIAENETTIEDAGCADISFPSFYGLMEGLKNA